MSAEEWFRKTFGYDGTPEQIRTFVEFFWVAFGTMLPSTKQQKTTTGAMIEDGNDKSRE